VTDDEADDLSALFERAEACARADPHNEGEERWQAVTALHARSEEAVFERAASWCTHDEPVLRALGADVLGQLDWRNEHPFRQRSAPLLDAMLDDGNPLVIAAALYAHGHLGIGTTDRLTAFATHADTDVRFALASALGGREDGGSIAALIALSTDQDSDVRDWATFGLGTQCDVDTEELREALVARLDDPDEDTRCEAMRGLAQRRDNRAEDPIEQALAKEEVCEIVIEAAGLLASPRFTRHLEDLLVRNPDDDELQEALARCRKNA